MDNISKMAKITAVLLIFSLAAAGNLVDTDNQPATTNTFIGDIDMSVGTVGDLQQFIAPCYSMVSKKALSAMDGLNATNVIKDIVTNTVIVGYTEWTYSGDTSTEVTYSITSQQSGDDFVFTLWNQSSGASLGTSTTNVMNPTTLSFTVTAGMITASRDPIERNANGLAMYSDVQALDNKLETIDTSYYRVVGITNKNQSIQYVYTDSNTTELQIQMPLSGMTKDWLVYVLAETNLTLKLPPANYWCVNEAVTNDIPGYTPTALYFSQINDDTYSIGRQNLIPITVQSQIMQMNNEIMKRIKKKNTSLRVSDVLNK